MLMLEHSRLRASIQLNDGLLPPRLLEANLTLNHRPLRKLLLQLFFAGQIELVFTGVDVGVFGQGDFYQRLVFLLAEHDADGGGFGVGFDVAVKVVDVHLHLAQVLVRVRVSNRPDAV